MKKFIEKIKSVMNNHPRLSVLFLLLILLIVIMIIYRIADKYMNNSTTETGTYYTYVGEIKYDFDADATINKKLVINNLKPANKMDFSSNPIIGEKRIIFPKDMLAVMPSDNYAEYRTLPYTYISEDKLITKDYNETLENYFLYDGEDTYFFSDAGTLEYNGNVISLSKYSYIVCSSESLIYYDYENDKVGKIDYTGNAVFKSNYYLVSVSGDYVGSDGNILPSGVEYIDTIANYNN